MIDEIKDLTVGQTNTFPSSRVGGVIFRLRGRTLALFAVRKCRRWAIRLMTSKLWRWFAFSLDQLALQPEWSDLATRTDIHRNDAVPIAQAVRSLLWFREKIIFEMNLEVQVFESHTFDILAFDVRQIAENQFIIILWIRGDRLSFEHPWAANHIDVDPPLDFSPFCGRAFRKVQK
jgi:hypothetical protein